MKLLDRNALVAEIEKLLNDEFQCSSYDEATGFQNALTKIKSFINTIEVKEVDLEKEIQDHLRECLNIKFPTTNVKLITSDVEYIARKFFELGLKAQKGE